MIKDFSRLFQKGNLTAKERVLLLIANTVSKDKGEKEFLSKADIYALSEGWTPANNDEVKEFNRYNQGWKIICYSEMDAQTYYLQTKLKYQTLQMMLRDFHYNPIYSEVKQALDGLEAIKRVEAKEAIEIINKQKQEKLKRGLRFEQAIYDLAFRLIDEETKKKLLELYEEAETDSEYLDQEQELAELYKNKDLEGIAEQVAERGFNEYINKYQLFHYYACIPIIEIAERYAKENNLPYKETTDDEDLKLIKMGIPSSTDKLADTLEQHAKEKQTTVKEIIKQTCLKWINEGLLEKDHTPIIIINPELLTKWIETKEKARSTLQDFVDKGELKTGKAERDGAEIITGESLYTSKLDYAFIKDFKDYVDDYEPDLGIVLDDKGEHIDGELLISQEKFFSRYKTLLERAKTIFSTLSIVEEKEENGEIVLDIADPETKTMEKGKIKEMFLTFRNNFITSYETLLAFEDLFKRASKVYEMDLTYRINLWITECKELIDDFNNTLLDALRVELPYSPQANKKKHYKDKELFIDTEKIKPNPITINLYVKELTNILGNSL